jgi:hypothetical protein
MPSAAARRPCRRYLGFIGGFNSRRTDHAMPSIRLLVLPTSLEASLLRKHPSFALLLPMRVDLRMLDATHAEFVYDQGWSGGRCALDLRDGEWRIATLGFRVT